MAGNKQTKGTIAQLMSADKAGRTIMAEYVCKLREANDPNLELKEEIVREAMERLSIHDLDRFDEELATMQLVRKEARK